MILPSLCKMVINPYEIDESSRILHPLLSPALCICSKIFRQDCRQCLGIIQAFRKILLENRKFHAMPKPVRVKRRGMQEWSQIKRSVDWYRLQVIPT